MGEEKIAMLRKVVEDRIEVIRNENKKHIPYNFPLIRIDELRHVLAEIERLEREGISSNVSTNAPKAVNVFGRASMAPGEAHNLEGSAPK